VSALCLALLLNAGRIAKVFRAAPRLLTSWSDNTHEVRLQVDRPVGIDPYEFESPAHRERRLRAESLPSISIYDPSAESRLRPVPPASAAQAR